MTLKKQKFFIGVRLFFIAPFITHLYWKILSVLGWNTLSSVSVSIFILIVMWVFSGVIVGENK